MGCTAAQESAALTAGRKWIAIDVTITNDAIPLLGPFGTEDAVVPEYAVNGQPLLAQTPRVPDQGTCPLSGFAEDGELGVVPVSGCSFLNLDGGLSIGATASGCVAVTVGPTANVESVGVGFGPGTTFPTHYVQWRV
jgi:hypothetical protein